MKKLFAIVVLLSVVGLAHAEGDFTMERDRNGNLDFGLKNAGLDKVQVVVSSNPALVSDVDGNTISQGLLYWIIRPSTGAVGTFLEVRATDTANLTSTRLLPWIPPSSIFLTTAAVNTNQVITFDPPIPFFNGLSVNTLPAGASGAVTGTEYSLGIRKKK